jgi:predicted DCC family thiol-disulfide oxidoreductase YuxK
MISEYKAILFYDGDCGLCSRSIRFLMKRDRYGWLHYAPIQGETAASMLNESLRENPSTIVYLRRAQSGENEILLKSEAVLQALIDIRSHWRWLAASAHYLPKSWRDSAYDWIARNRLRFFGNESCALANETAQARLLK